MEIIELNDDFFEDFKGLLVELQKYVVSIDKYKLNKMSPDYGERYTQKTLEEIKENGGKIFIAVSGGKAVGAVCGYMEKYTEMDKLDFTCPKRGIITELIVSESCRAGGVGKVLMEKMEEYFALCGAEFILLDVFAYNENAKNFYLKKGYEERMVTLMKKVDKND